MSKNISLTCTGSAGLDVCAEKEKEARAGVSADVSVFPNVNVGAALISL